VTSVAYVLIVMSFSSAPTGRPAFLASCSSLSAMRESSAMRVNPYCAKRAATPAPINGPAATTTRILGFASTMSNDSALLFLKSCSTFLKV
jgi:hypothetical protein